MGMDRGIPATRLLLKEFVMPSPDSEARARAELVDLLESQLKTLENQTFGCVTEPELRK